MFKILDKIGEIGILPVLNISDTASAVPLAHALCGGGVPVMEITMRTPAAVDAIRMIKEEMPEMVVGAGTALSVKQIDAAVEAGADFVVSPGFNPVTVKYCLEKDIPIIPGCVTATDLERGTSMGISVFKFFPAEQMGGLKAMELLAGPFPNVRFVPTGGLNFDLLPKYLASSKIFACGGSYMAGKDLIREKKWNEIESLCKKAVRISMGFELAHIGINHEDAQQGEKTAEWFCRAFDFPAYVHSNSVFAGTAVESLKGVFSGTKGHIGFYTVSMARAVAYLKSKGFHFREENVTTDENGCPKWLYFNEEVGGFAVHIVQKQGEI